MSNTKKTTNETAPIETAAALVPFYVVITVCDLETGQAVPVSRHDCRDRLHAQTLLTELRELAADLAEFLPGMAATGFELGEPKLQSFADMIETGGLREEDKLYWRNILAEEKAEDLRLGRA